MRAPPLYRRALGGRCRLLAARPANTLPLPCRSEVQLCATIGSREQLGMGSSLLVFDLR
jgi:hypothetical protein